MGLIGTEESPLKMLHEYDSDKKSDFDRDFNNSTKAQMIKDLMRETEGNETPGNRA